MKTDTVTALEENRKNSADIGLDKGFFLDMTPKAQIVKAKIKWECNKLKSFYTTKEIIKMKRQLTKQENLSASHILRD